MNNPKPLYIHTEDAHNTRAAEVIIPLLFQYIQPKSILDVGCGTGTWLKVLENHGITDFHGVDGDYVDRESLMIDSAKFIPHDLTKALKINKKFDLVICLEVAEHLPKNAADTLIESLIRHGNLVLFSAAIPGQGGQNHINEQWPDYWSRKFKRYEFVRYDIIRPQIWFNSVVDVWYRQNIFLFARENKDFESLTSITSVPSYIHPDLWMDKIRLLNKIKEENKGFDKGRSGINRSFRAAYNAIKLKFSNVW